MSTPPPPAPRGTSTGRMVAIGVGVIFGVILLAAVGLGIAGYLFATRVNITTDRDEKGREAVSVETPFGRLRVDTGRPVDPDQMGIPIYPGATQVPGDVMNASVDLDLDFADKSLRVAAAELETPDPIDQVIEFYRDEAADFTFAQKSSGKVEFIWREGDLRKVVGIREHGGKTRISLASVGHPEAH